VCIHTHTHTHICAEPNASKCCAYMRSKWLELFGEELLQAKADEDAREKAEEQWRDDVNGKWHELEDWRKKEEVCVRE